MARHDTAESAARGVTSYTMWVRDLPVVWARDEAMIAAYVNTQRQLHNLTAPQLFVMPHA